MDVPTPHRRSSASLLNLSRRYQFMIGVLALTAYAPTLRLGFLWDDHVMIEANTTLRQWSLANLKHDFTTDVFDHHGDPYYRPLQTLMDRVDFSLWELRPFGYHLTNFLFHLGNALLIAELALAIGALPLTAFVAGSLFAVHPIAVEQLMIIAGRAELMGLFFPLLTLLLYLQNDRRSFYLAWGTYIAALLSKESAVITPVLIALALYARHESMDKFKRLLPMGIVIIPYLWLRHQMVGPFIAQQDLWLTARFFTEEFPRVLGHYVYLLLIPWNLYSHRFLPHLTHAWPLSLLLGLIACGFLVKTYQRLGIFCIGWFIAALLPKTPVMIYGNFMLDHWAYPAAFSVLFPLAALVARGWQSRREGIRTLTAVLYFGALILGSLLVHLNVELRGTDEKMYRWALHFTTSNPIKYNLGILLLQTHRPEEAAYFLEEVRAVYPDDANNANALALCYWEIGKRWLAIKILEDYDKRYPGDPATRTHLRRLKTVLPSKK